MLIFVLQTIWLYIKELAGKDLDIIVVGKFLFYFSPKLIPLVLPLTILLSSIMVFGNFAENYEFAAMKSTGISLQRAMKGLSVFIVGLAIITFFFSNNVIPWAEYNSYNLRKNIAKLKPAMVIAEGQFNEIGNITIKVDEKSGDRGQYLKGVVLHQKNSNRQGNYTTIKSETGELVSKEDSEVLRLILYNGNYYDDTPPKDYKDRFKRPFKKSDFKAYTLNIDLSEINKVDLEEKNITDKYNMLNIRDLSYTIDSLQTKRKEDYSDFADVLYKRTNIDRTVINQTEQKDSTSNVTDVLDLFNIDRKLNIIDLSLNTVKSTNQIIDNKERSFRTSNVWLNKHIIALHEKLALGFACIILFFVGAPLGAIIRKGGIGLPMVIAILLFLTYHFIGIFAKNSAKEGSLNPVIATWFSTIVMLPLSVFLTRRATADRGLFEFDNFIEPFKKFLPLKDTDADQDEITVADRLKKFDNNRLFEIYKNPSLEEYDDSVKPLVYTILDERGISIEDYKANNIVLSESLLKSKKHVKDFNDYAKFSVIFYILTLVLGVLYFVFTNNNLLPVANASVQLSIIFGFVYLVYLIVSTKILRQFYNSNNLQKRFPNPVILLVGFILYPILNIFLKDRLQTDFKQITYQSLK